MGKSAVNFKYSKILSSFFCSMAIIVLSLLCLLNNLSIDIYSTVVLLKVVVPASFAFWIIGYIIGATLDSLTKEIKQKKTIEEKKAYEIPSMFGPDTEGENDIENLEVL